MRDVDGQKHGLNETTDFFCRVKCPFIMPRASYVMFGIRGIELYKMSRPVYAELGSTSSLVPSFPSMIERFPRYPRKTIATYKGAVGG